MQKKRTFWTKIVVLFLLAPLFVGCGVGKKDFLPQLLDPFSCRVTGECGGEPFTATVTAGAWETDGDGRRTRSLRVVYTAPAHLRGLVATFEGDEYSLTLDGVRILESHLSGFLLPARLLGDVFTVTGTRAEKKEGMEVCFVSGSSEDGSRQVEVDAESGSILSASGTLFGIYAEFYVEDLENIEE